MQIMHMIELMYDMDMMDISADERDQEGKTRQAN
jgi:hypothetical protein